MKKYITPIVCSVLLIISLLMGAPSDTSIVSGKGNGTDSQVKTIDQFVDVLEFFNNFKLESDDNSSAQVAGGTYSAGSAEENLAKYTSATFYNKSRASSSYSASYSGKSYSSNSKYTRELTIYLTKTAAYYKSVGIIMQNGSSSTDGGTESYSNYVDFDLDIYITTKTSYVKFNKFDITSSGDGATSENFVTPEMLGKWFDASEIAEEMLELNEENYEILYDMGLYFERNKLTHFTQTNGVYTLNKDYLQDVFSDIFDTSFPEDGRGSFSVNLSNSVKPSINFVMSTTANSNSTYSVYSTAYSENNMVFSNINNTIIRFNPSRVYDIEDFINEEDWI